MSTRVWTPDGVTDKYRVLLEAISRDGDANEAGSLTSHWPILGASDRRILVVGQAAFGWIPNWTVADLRSSAGIERVIAATQAPCYDRDDPMSWIAENRARSSPFWRCVRHVIEEYLRDPTVPWYSHVAWANLYPIAPNDVRGNPADHLREVQRPYVVDLLDAVVSAADPELVLLLVGFYWWGVSAMLPIDSAVAVDCPLFAAGRRGDRVWISGMHPKGAQLQGWPADVYAARIVLASRSG